MTYRGRVWWLLTARRLKSFKCFALVAVVLNLVLFMSLAWKSMPRTPNSKVLPAGQVESVDFGHTNGVQIHLLVERSKQRAEAELLQKAVPSEPVKSHNKAEAELLQKAVPSVPDKSHNKAEIELLQKDVPSEPVKSHKKAGVGGVTTRLTSHVSRGPAQKTACSYRTVVYLSDKQIVLDQSPFVDYVKAMACLEGGDIAVFADKFVRFNNGLVDSAKIISAMKGGEKIEEVWNQKEDKEYFSLSPGYFKVSCVDKPYLPFSHVDHLSGWAKILECYRPNTTDLTLLQTVRGTTLAIQRYEYVNLYHTMTDFYNAFVLMLIFGVHPSKLNILAVDAHPEGTLDPVWLALFGKFIRAGRLPQPIVFENLVWGLLGYFSPLNEHERSSVPYLDEFREFFLSRHNISTSHAINCSRLNVLLIWRRNYVAHPRNQKGSVVRKFDNEDEMVQEVRDTLGEGASVRGMQLDTMVMTDQLQAVTKADILVGMHGAGLSHILFLPATSGVVELKPEYTNPALQHFKSMAAWRHIPYTIWHNFDMANERADHKTYIPRSVMRKTIKDIRSQICAVGHS